MRDSINIILNKRNDVDGINIKIGKLLENVRKTNFIDFSNTDYFLLLEKLKTIIFKDSPKKIVLFERYYLSTLAHTYAMGIFNNDFEPYLKVLAWYHESINKTLLKPDAYIFIEAPMDLLESRVNQRSEEVVNSVWIDKKYMQICEEYKKKFIENYENDVKVFFVDGSKCIAEVNDEISRLLKVL
ncbi:MAG: deoxynucleoside kinase [Anaeroplasmataceae bacterium]|nr:deoxynucleoside kinase [Anaeroplasmataceae bacterium]